MRFIVQRKSDHKYYGGEATWVPTEHDAELFQTQSAAETFCTLQPDDKFDIFIRLRTGRIVRSVEKVP